MIILYSNGCPRCNVLKTKLDQKNIEYEYVTSIDTMIDLGITLVPMLKVDDHLMDFNEAIKWVNNK